MEKLLKSDYEVDVSVISLQIEFCYCVLFWDNDTISVHRLVALLNNHPARPGAQQYQTRRNDAIKYHRAIPLSLLDRLYFDENNHLTLDIMTRRNGRGKEEQWCANRALSSKSVLKG
ncbi:hypothetical protein CBL_13185 [Carabus blaptoides fortunei]